MTRTLAQLSKNTRAMSTKKNATSDKRVKNDRAHSSRNTIASADCLLTWTLKAGNQYSQPTSPLCSSHSHSLHLLPLLTRTNLGRLTPVVSQKQWLNTLSETQQNPTPGINLELKHKDTTYLSQPQKYP